MGGIGVEVLLRIQPYSAVCPANTLHLVSEPWRSSGPKAVGIIQVIPGLVNFAPAGC